jgi:hypothetical protein
LLHIHFKGETKLKVNQHRTITANLTIAEAKEFEAYANREGLNSNQMVKQALAYMIRNKPSKVETLAE